MTTITKDIVAKLAVAFVAVAMVLVAFAPSAQAQTTEELQAMINDLLAQVAALQGGGDAPMAAGVCPYTWTRDLSTGSTGADVMTLQQFLNADPDTRVAASGVGSPGMETSYYGALTAAAVDKFQVKYRAEVLTPNALVNPTGYFGASSRAKANDLCVTPVVDDGDDEDGMEDDDDEDDGGSQTLSGEAALDTFEIDDAEDDELEEGAEDAPVAELTFEFTDGDAELSRMDMQFIGSGDEQDPWDVFESISLWVDGDKIAEEAADDEDDYLDEDDGDFRFSGLDLFMPEDEEVEIIVAVTLQNSLDGVSDGEDWTVEVNSIRFFDAEGVAVSEEAPDFDFGDTANFSIEEEGYEDELIVKTSSSDPDSATLQLEDDSDSDWYTVFIFDLDTDDSINDIELDGVDVTVNVSSSTYNTIVDDAELVIDGETVDDFTVAGGGTATAVLTFDVDGDVVIDAGDRVEAELRLQFNSLALGNEGMTVDAEVTATNADDIDAEGADDLDPATQLSGSASGDTHTLRTAGADISPESTSAVVTNVDGANNDYATFEIEVEVTAFEQDVYIAQDAAVSIDYDLVDGSGSVISGSGATTTVLTSNADEQGAYFEITEGQTETVTLTVTYEPGASQSARLRLNSVAFNEAASAPNQTQSTLPATDYRTKVVTIVD